MTDKELNGIKSVTQLVLIALALIMIVSIITVFVQTVILKKESSDPLGVIVPDVVMEDPCKKEWTGNQSEDARRLKDCFDFRGIE